MGYDISLRVRQDELDERFKASGYSKVTDVDVDKYKEVIISYVTNIKFKEGNFIEYINVYDNIAMAVKIQTQYIIEQWKKMLKSRLESNSEFDGSKDEISFCGWRFAKGNDNSDTDIDLVISNYTHALWEAVTIAPYVDYYNEHNKFDERYSNIKRIVYDYSDIICDTMDLDFVETYRDHICGGDEYEADDIENKPENKQENKSDEDVDVCTE